MSLEKITVQAGGLEYQGWESVSVTAGIAQAARSFEIATTEIIKAYESPFDIWNFPPFTPMSLFANGDLLVQGNVDDYLPSSGAENHSVVVRGTGPATDLVMGSPDHPTGRFEQETVLNILKALAGPYSVVISAAEVAAEAANKVVSLFQLRRGETVWSESLRLLGDYGATLAGQADGELVIMRAGKGRHAGAIAQGDMPGSVPIKEMSADLSGAGRYSQYRVTYQDSLGTEEDVFEGEATAEDSGVPRFRLREIIAATEMDANRAKSLAMWTASRAAGFSAKATLVVLGFRDSAGTLWDPGNLVFVFAPFLKIESDMVITEAIFSQSNDGGTTTTLTVMDPQAFFGNASAASGSGGIWDFKVF